MVNPFWAKPTVFVSPTQNPIDCPEFTVSQFCKLPAGISAASCGPLGTIWAPYHHAEAVVGTRVSARTRSGTTILVILFKSSTPIMYSSIARSEPKMKRADLPLRDNARHCSTMLSHRCQVRNTEGRNPMPGDQIRRHS